MGWPPLCDFLNLPIPSDTIHFPKYPEIYLTKDKLLSDGQQSKIEINGITPTEQRNEVDTDEVQPEVTLNHTHCQEELTNCRDFNESDEIMVESQNLCNNEYLQTIEMPLREHSFPKENQQISQYQLSLIHISEPTRPY